MYSSYEAMHCLFHSSSDERGSCLLDGELTSCGTYKCFQTVGKRCSVENDAKLTGYVCAKSLFCGDYKILIKVISAKYSILFTLI